jgi:O-antigen/teichoic acid export membrane protein
MGKQFLKKKLIKDISANTVQAVTTNLFGLIIFYITSRYLSKSDFGEFNWSMAVGSTVIAIASLGLDLVLVKRIALGKNVLVMSGIHFFHTLIVGVVLSSIIFLAQLLVPALKTSHPLFFFIFLNLALANIANSFKLCLNGLESYRKLAILALCTNIFKLVLIIILYVTARFNVFSIIFAYAAASLLEFLVGYFFMSSSLSARVKPLLIVSEYKYFILESLPQLGVVLFDSALARIDWILLGIISTVSVTAEYSFAYKVFELSRLPLLIIAPVLLTRFSKMFENGLSDPHKESITLFVKLELFVIMIIPILLISSWSPLIDYFTNDKYGAVNEINFIVLSICVPFSCLINFLWTMGFVQGQLKSIMFITITVSVLNIIANALLIPFYGSFGASVAFLICTLIQFLLYLKKIKQDQVKLNIKNSMLAFTNAAAALLAGKFLSNNVIFTSVMALGIYMGLTFITGQLKLKEVKQLIRRG